jgi:alcohol dehydrogenase (cytochrome c)
MSAAALAWSERWQVVGYIRSLQAATGIIANPIAAGTVSPRVSSETLRDTGTRSGEWPTYSGSLDGTRYTPLSDINRTNVSELRVRWVQQFDMADEPIEATPLVVGGRMFLTLPPASVVALDAQNGSAVWRYDHPLPPALPLCCRRINRGVAMLDDVVYFASLDATLVALDASTGRVKWQFQIANPADGYTMTGAPLVAGRAVVVGVGGAEFGIRGFLAAYDASTGALLWKFETIPGPGSPGHKTWENDAWKTGGGSTWVTGSYDPVLDLVFWGVGNPAPDFSRDERPGDNLFTNSVIALHGRSGTLAWHFQFTPHDDRDWDSAQTPVLADLLVGGEPLRVICWPNRNGFYYVLERSTGRFLAGVPFVEQNWATGLDSAGRPVLPTLPADSDGRRVIKPGVGGTNWQNAAFDATTGLIFVPATEGASVFTKSSPAKRGSGGQFLGSWGSPVEGPTPVVRALSAATGARKWENYSPPLGGGTFSYSGLLATGGGLVFGASGGSVFALDSSTGRELWEVSLGGDSRAAPISFTVDGQQLIAVSVGRSMFAFARPTRGPFPGEQ